MPRPPSKPFTFWSDGLDVSWTVPKTRAALLEHEDGYFQSSSMMVDAMGRDDRIRAVLNTRVSGLLGLPRTMVPASEDSEAMALAELIDERFDEWAPSDALAELLGWYHMIGIGFAQIIWTFKEREWHPRLQIWHPQHLRWDPEFRVFMLNTKQGEIQIDLESGQWLMLARGQRPWMSANVRALAVLWLTRQWCWRDHNRFNERHGLPFVAGLMPANAAEKDKDAFFNGLRGLTSNTYMTLPQGVAGADQSFDVKLVEAKDGAYETFGDLKSSADTAIAVLFLGQNLTTEVAGGSFAAAQVHERVRMDLTEGDEKELSALADTLIEFWARFNLGSGAQVPTARWETAPPEDVKTTAETLRTLGEAFEKLSGQGIRITDDSRAELFNKVGVRVEDGEPDRGEPADAEPPAESIPDDVDDEDRDELSSVARETVRVRPTLRLQSGDNPDDDRGFTEGQMYVDRVVEDAQRSIAPQLQRQLAALTSSAQAADSYVEARELVERQYAQDDTEETRIGETLAAVAILAVLAGRVAVKKDAVLMTVPARIARVDTAVDALATKAGIDLEELTELFTHSDRIGHIRGVTIRAQAAQAAIDKLGAAEIAGLDLRDAQAGLLESLERTYGPQGTRGTIATVNLGQQEYNRGRWEGLAAEGGSPFSYMIRS